VAFGESTGPSVIPHADGGHHLRATERYIGHLRVHQHEAVIGAAGRTRLRIAYGPAPRAFAVGAGVALSMFTASTR